MLYYVKEISLYEQIKKQKPYDKGGYINAQNIQV
jgi:hypothetical protein